MPTPSLCWTLCPLEGGRVSLTRTTRRLGSSPRYASGPLSSLLLVKLIYIDVGGAQHCKNIQSQGSGKAVWLRFGVDMNYWQSDDGGHKYSGNADDFKKAWKVLAKALKETSPDTKLLWTPAASSVPAPFRYPAKTS